MGTRTRADRNLLAFSLMAAMLSMIYEMGMSAEQSCRRLRGFRQLGKVIEGVKFANGIEVIQDGRAAA